MKVTANLVLIFCFYQFAECGILSTISKFIGRTEFFRRLNRNDACDIKTRNVGLLDRGYFLRFKGAFCAEVQCNMNKTAEWFVCPSRKVGTEQRCNTTSYLSKRNLYYPDCCEYLECWYFERAKAGTLNVVIPPEEKSTDGPYPFKMGTNFDNDNHNNRYESDYNRTTSEEYKLKKSQFFM